MGHYMTKEGVETICKNCLYWGNTYKFLNKVLGSCGNANQKLDYVFYFNDADIFGQKQSIGNSEVKKGGNIYGY